VARPLQLPPQPLWLRLHCDVSAQRNRTPVPFGQSFASLNTPSPPNSPLRFQEARVRKEKMSFSFLCVFFLEVEPGG
jgi:hypothetical protein